MGGLIAVKAFRKLEQFQKGKVKPDDSKSFEIASADLDLGDLVRKGSAVDLKEPTSTEKGWFRSWFSKELETKEIKVAENTLESIPVVPDQPTELELAFSTDTSSKQYVNVAAIICFDSPFNGLNPTVFTFAAGDQAADI